jgi:hypothetical protein
MSNVEIPAYRQAGKCQTNVKIPNEENLGFEIWDSFEL